MHNRLKNTFGLKLEQKNSYKYYKLSITQNKNINISNWSVQNKYSQDISIILQHKIKKIWFHPIKWSIDANIKKNENINAKIILGGLAFDIFRHSLMFKSGNLLNSRFSFEFKASTVTPLKSILQRFQKLKSENNDSEQKEKKPKVNKKQIKMYEFVPENLLLKYDINNWEISLDYNLK